MAKKKRSTYILFIAAYEDGTTHRVRPVRWRS